MWKKIKPYVISVAIALGVGGLAALLTRNNMDIYSSINQPPLTPPGVLFPIVWTILYTLMGISSAKVWTKGREDGDSEWESAIFVYGVQLLMNFIWSIIFFNMRAYLFAFIWLIALWLLIIVMIRKFYQIDPLAAWLQVPYLLWVTFAAYLNLAIFILNR